MTSLTLYFGPFTCKQLKHHFGITTVEEAQGIPDEKLLQVTGVGKMFIQKLRRLKEPEQPQTIHEWFELSYAQYLTIPRLVLDTMPLEWQHKFTALLNELDDKIDWRPKSGRYWVRLKDDHGRYVHDPLMDYRHGRVPDELKKHN